MEHLIKFLLKCNVICYKLRLIIYHVLYGWSAYDFPCEALSFLCL